MTKKEELLYLLNNYKLSTSKDFDIFCDEFSRVFYHSENFDDVGDLENDIFEKLAYLCSRYSPFIKDREKYPKVYADENCIISAIDKCKKSLTNNEN